MDDVREAFNVIERYLPLPEMKFVSNTDFEWKTYPAVVKPATMEHKTDKGAVYTNIYDEVTLKGRVEHLLNRYEKVIIQEQVRGFELLLGMKRDEIFGDVMIFGWGGIYTELLHRVTARLIPINGIDAMEMVEEIGVPSRFRGIDIPFEEIVRALVKFSQMVTELKPVSVEINPLIVNDKGVFVVDVRSQGLT